MRKVVLCCHRELYQKRLGDFLRKYHQGDFIVECRHPVKEMQWDDAHVMLTDDEELWQRSDKEKVFYLDFNDTGKGITPYQPGDELVRYLLWNWSGRKEPRKIDNCKLVVFYTPGGSSRQKSAAIQKAITEGMQGRCLYIPIREFYNREPVEIVPYDLSELCYLVRGGKALTVEKVQAAVEKQSEYDSLRGFRSPVHLIGLTQEVGKVLEYIREQCNYKTLVMDMQFLLPDYKEIFAVANEVYRVEDPMLEEMGTENCVQQGIDFLEMEGVISREEYRIWKWEEESYE